MKNLKLNSHQINKINEKEYFKFCIDSVTNTKYVADLEGIFLIKANHEAVLFKAWKDLEDNIQFTKLVSIEVITSLNSVCVTTFEGDVITLNLEDATLDVVGKVESGIMVSSWSPDQEILVLVTGNLTIILMTASFDPLVEFPLEQDDFGENKFVTIGWGKKETQFHGMEGKQAAKVTKTRSTIFEWDDKTPKITWRGDGQLFAIGYVDSSNARRIRVVKREGIIQSASEDVEGLEDNLCWRPSGNLIASSQRLNNKHNIIFFEKNGLQHGGFTLPFDSQEMKVKNILWNQDSTILALWLQQFVNKDYSFIQFWMVGNYHWYLKEEIIFKDKVFDMAWHPEDPMIVNLLTGNTLHELRFVSLVDTSRGTSRTDNAQVAVIDGKKLLITPFRQAVVPPPLSAYEIIFKDQIHSVMYAPPVCRENIDSPDNSLSIEDSGFLEVLDAPGCSSNNLCVFHGTKTLTFLVQAQPNEHLSDLGADVNITSVGGNGFCVKTHVHRVASQNTLEWHKDTHQTFYFTHENLYNWNWISKNIIVCSCRDGLKTLILIFDLEGIGTENSRVLARNPIYVEEEVLSISSSLDGSVVCLQLITGELLQLNVTEGYAVPWTENGDVKFPTPCDQVILCPLESDIYYPIGRTSRNRLYIGSTQLLSDCTSMHLHTDHLLFTTTSHSLLVVPKNLELLKSLLQEVKEAFTQIGSRRVERGSRIVTAVPCDTQVLLQMPRGNLEMINPRPLTVHTLKNLLDEKNYHLAFNIMRKQRIDLNLIYDHCPDEFLKNIEQFIRKVDNANWIDIFIASLSNTDVTKTAYSSNYSGEIKYSNSTHTNKIDLVCESLREGMVKIDEDKYLLPTLSTYVKSSKDEIHLALMKLKEMKNNGRVYKVTFDDGLRHLLYVADENELCDVALGTYDFELIMLLFEKSEKDPKEYLPFLNELKQMEENYRKFKINVYLKRFRKALECMVHCEDKYHKECMSLIRKESLYLDALEVFTKDSPLYLSSCKDYGDYLLKAGYENEAAIMYTRAQQLESAMKAYELGNNWRMVLVTASELNYTKEELNHLCYSLVEKLKCKYCFVDAAAIYEKYILSEEDAVECYCNAHMWEEAILVCSRHNRKDLLETNVKPGILDHFYTVEQQVLNTLANFKMHLDRLAVVRENKMREFQESLDNVDESHLDVDLYSDTGTITGFTQRSNTSKSVTASTSGKSYRSSKNKRKLDRKKYSTKEGSNFEDIGLIASLHETMTTIEILAPTVSDLNRVLLMIDEDSKAKGLQTKLEKVIQEMKKSKFVIWPNCVPEDEESIQFGSQMTTESAVQMLQGAQKEKNSYLTQRMQALEPHLRFPPNLDRIKSWKLYSIR